MSGDPLPPESVMVIDTSVVIAIGTPDNEKYRALEQYVTRNGITVRVPDDVASELGTPPTSTSTGTRVCRPHRMLVG